VLNVMATGALTNVSALNVRQANYLNLYGGVVGGNYTNSLGGTIFVEGIFQGYGSVVGNMQVSNNGIVVVSNTVAPLTIQHNFLMMTNTAALQMTLGNGFHTMVVNSNIMLTGKLNLIDGGGFTCTTYPLITYSGNIIYTNIVVVGTVTNVYTNSFITVNTTPDNTKTYTIDTNTPGQVNLIVTGCGSGLPFKITSITRSGNDVTVNWNTSGSPGQFNYVQASPGSANGSYPGTFVDIATITIAGTTASFTDVGGVTGNPHKYYRIRSPQ